MGIYRLSELQPVFKIARENSQLSAGIWRPPVREPCPLKATVGRLVDLQVERNLSEIHKTKRERKKVQNFFIETARAAATQSTSQRTNPSPNYLDGGRLLYEASSGSSDSS